MSGCCSFMCHPAFKLHSESRFRLAASGFAVFHVMSTHFVVSFCSMTKSRPEIVIEVAVSVPPGQQGVDTVDAGLAASSATGAGGTTQQLPERRWYQLQLWGKPGGDTDLLSETPPTLPIGLIYRWSWRSWFVASAVARVAYKGVPFAALGVEEWVRRTMHALLEGRASVWRAVVRPSPTLRTLEGQGMLPFLQARAAPVAAAGATAKDISAGPVAASDAKAPSQLQAQPQARIDAVRISVYDYTFQPLLGWPSTGTQGQVQAQATGAAAAGAVPQAVSAAAASSGSDKAGVGREGGTGSIGARRGIPLSPPLPQPYSTTGTFPQREAGSVWERTRLCTYYIAQRQDVTLSAAEIFGGGCLHVSPLLEKLPLPATA